MTAHGTLHGTIENTGGENCDSRGFDWGYETGVYPYNWTENGSYGTGTFEHQITGLPLNITVYFRAKAHNSVGWGYGSEKSFATPSAVTYHMTTTMVRAMVGTVGKAKLTRNGIVINLREGIIPFGTQTPLKRG
jgi:hypothetical protein